MGQEDKELLIKELCARLPYELKAVTENKIVTIRTISINPKNDEIVHVECYHHYRYFYKALEWVKPYLFPLSSMTEEQYKEFNNLTYSVRIDGIRGHHEYFINPDIGSKWLTDLNGKNEIIMTDLQDYLVCIGWLNKHHFDYHRLIDKGLAIDCTNLNIY